MSEVAPSIPSTEAVPLSKKAQKKLEKEKKKTENKQAKQQQQQQQQQQCQALSGEDVSTGKYGKLPVLQSTSRPGRLFTHLSELDEQSAGKKILLRARIHSSRGKGNLVFLVLRERFHTIQAVASKSDTVSKQFLKFLSDINRESIIDVEGSLREADVSTCTIKKVELNIETLFVVSESEPNLPIQLEDAERPEPILDAQRAEIQKLDSQIEELTVQLGSLTEEKLIADGQKRISELEAEKVTTAKYVDLSREARLNNRIIDLRTITNQAIFRIQSGVSQLFREYLIARDFVEIHTPKLIPAASEGGADVFELTYFGRKAYLAQSPQLYKQMCICGDMNRVYEIAPVFRSEDSNTHRHMTEFIGLDLEMTIQEHYHEVLDVLEGLFFNIFEQLEARFATELAIIQRQYPFEPLRYNKASPLRLTYSQAIDLLKETHPDYDHFYSIGTSDEKELGKIIHQKFNTDFYLIDKFPLSHRPFYTMPDPYDPQLSNSYDFFIRGEEILSGAQRVHDANLLTERIKSMSIDPTKLKDYIDAFRFGAPPHGGGGIGLERVVMLYLGLNNIRLSSLYPRTPKRITP